MNTNVERLLFAIALSVGWLALMTFLNIVFFDHIGISEQHVKLDNGDRITCLLLQGPTHSLSCDWNRP